jgi:hypothetical protein
VVNTAVNAAVALDPVSLSFGAVPSGSGQSKTGTIALSSLSGPSGAWQTLGIRRETRKFVMRVEISR